MSATTLQQPVSLKDLVKGHAERTAEQARNASGAQAAFLWQAASHWAGLGSELLLGPANLDEIARLSRRADDFAALGRYDGPRHGAELVARLTPKPATPGPRILITAFGRIEVTEEVYRRLM
ncbi:hypothetical protein [Streptomyces sp. NBC_01304]|uniref:hypothetical protein n=1 Tax=Streptomyces sp. NBC_01304 TaxID=2903818 RepID=UPI002E14E762|nr:hypothetical protein OG430_48720 [Streptomyces sp. NBC_01304]